MSRKTMKKGIQDGKGLGTEIHYHVDAMIAKMLTSALFVLLEIAPQNRNFQY